MADDLRTRAELTYKRVGRLLDEVNACDDVERLAAIREQIQVQLDSLCEIRIEQLRAEQRRGRFSRPS